MNAHGRTMDMTQGKTLPLMLCFAAPVMLEHLCCGTAFLGGQQRGYGGLLHLGDPQTAAANGCGGRISKTSDRDRRPIYDALIKERLKWNKEN